MIVVNSGSHGVLVAVVAVVVAEEFVVVDYEGLDDVGYEIEWMDIFLN